MSSRITFVKYSEKLENIGFKILEIVIGLQHFQRCMRCIMHTQKSNLSKTCRYHEHATFWKESFRKILDQLSTKGVNRGRNSGCPTPPRTDPNVRNYRTGLLSQELMHKRLDGYGWDIRVQTW